MVWVRRHSNNEGAGRLPLAPNVIGTDWKQPRETPIACSSAYHSQVYAEKRK